MSPVRTSICAALLCMVMPATAPASESVPVSASGMNRFTFSVPYESVVIPKGAPLKAPPVSIGRRMSVLLEIDSDRAAPFQMIVQLVDGRVLDFLLTPSASAAPARWEQPTLPPAEYRRPVQRPEDSQLVAIHRAAALGRVPPGFATAAMPNNSRVGAVEMIYRAAYRSPGYVLLVAEVHSQTPTDLFPQDFYADGVRSVQLDGERAGPGLRPVVYVLLAGDRS
jgi:hypothetical protein